jgi:hypothetical protein
MTSVRGFSIPEDEVKYTQQKKEETMFRSLMYSLVFLCIWFLSCVFFTSIDWLGTKENTVEDIQLIRILYQAIMKMDTAPLSSPTGTSAPPTVPSPTASSLSNPTSLSSKAVVVGPWAEHKLYFPCVLHTTMEHFESIVQMNEAHVRVEKVTVHSDGDPPLCYVYSSHSQRISSWPWTRSGPQYYPYIQVMAVSDIATLTKRMNKSFTYLHMSWDMEVGFYDTYESAGEVHAKTQRFPDVAGLVSSYMKAAEKHIMKRSAIKHTS